MKARPYEVRYETREGTCNDVVYATSEQEAIDLVAESYGIKRRQIFQARRIV